MKPHDIGLPSARWTAWERDWCLRANRWGARQLVQAVFWPAPR